MQTSAISNLAGLHTSYRQLELPHSSPQLSFPRTGRTIASACRDVHSVVLDRRALLPNVVHWLCVAFHVGSYKEDLSIDQRERKEEGAHNIQYQHGTVGIGVVPNFMLVSIIEHQAFSFLPRSYVLVHPNPAATFRLWDNQSKVIAQHSFVHPAMRRDMLSGGQDGEHR